MAGRRLTLNDLLNDDPSPPLPQRPPGLGAPDCFPLSLQASSARRTPSPPRGRYDPLSDARVSASAGSSGGMSSHSRSPSVPFPGRYLTGPGYSPSMSLPRQPLPPPPQQHSPSPLGGLEALVEAASAEQRRMHDESARRGSAGANDRKRKRPSDPAPPPPRVLSGPGMQPSELSDKEREVIGIMSAARAASRSPEHARSPVVARTPGPRRPWEDSPTPSPATWLPREPIHVPAATVPPTETRRVELQPSEPIVLRRVQLTADTPMDVDIPKRSSSPLIPLSTSPSSSRYTFKSPVTTPKQLPSMSKPPSTSSKPSSVTSKPSSTASKSLSGPSKPPSVTTKPPSLPKQPAVAPISPPAAQPPMLIPQTPLSFTPKISPTTSQLPPVPSKTPTTTPSQPSPPLPKVSPTTTKSPSLPSKPPSASSKPPSATSKAASPPPRSPSPPPSRSASHSPELPSFAGPSWGARPSLAKLTAPTKARPPKPAKRERANVAPAASTSPISATSALPAASPVIKSPVVKSPVLPAPTPTLAVKHRESESVERMLEESAGLVPTPPPQAPVPAPAPREKEKGKARENEKEAVKEEKPVPVPAATPAPVAASVSVPEPTHASIPAPAPSPPHVVEQLRPEPIVEPAPSAPEPPPAPAPIQTTPAAPPAPAPVVPPSPLIASPALDADEELARSLDAQLNRRARPERERRRTEKLRDAQPDLEVLLAQAERERPAASSKNRARDRKRAEEAARKKQEEERAAAAKVKAKEEGERGREKRRKVDDDDELDAELLSLVGDRPSPVPAKARDATAVTASPPPPLHTKAELDRESMPPPPSPVEERAPSVLVPQKRGPGRPPGAKNKSKLGGTPASAVPAKKKPAAKKSTPGARSRSSSVMPMPSSSLAHEVKFDTDDDESQPERGVSMEIDRAPEPEDAIAQAWAQREERERAKKEEKEREKAAREARKREIKERVTEKENRKEKGAGAQSDEDEDEEDDKLYCVCKMPYDEDKVMIACDRCDEWYHTSCVDMPDSEVDLVDQFICPPCVEKDPHLNLRTTYKRRCQRGLEDDGACNRPSRGALSKYCSDACGIAAARSRIGAWNGDRAALWESVRGAERREGVVVRILDSTSLPNSAADGSLLNANGNRPPTVIVNGDGIVVLPSKPRYARALARLNAQLEIVVAQRESVTRALESASWRRRLLELATARADADLSTCGWDQRLCFGDDEIAEFGGGVFDSYEKDAAKRAERAASEATDGEREGSDEDEDGEKKESDKMEVDGEEEDLEAQWWCNGRKKCDRHAGWQKLKQADIECDQEMKTAALERLTTREREIRGRVEDILDPHAAPPPSGAQDEDESMTPEPAMVNGHTHGGAARVNGTDAVVKKSHKMKST